MEGAPSGMLVSILRNFAGKAGLDLEYTFCSDRESTREMLLSGDYDVFVGVHLISGLCAQLGFINSAAVIQTTLAYAQSSTKSLPADERDITISLVRGLEEQISTAGYKAVVLCGDAEGCIQTVESGKADVAAAVKALREFGPFESFKVHAKRSNTDFELTSIDINRQVGEVLCEAFPDKKVQMHDPDAMVHVLVVQGSVYVYARSERGVGGLPVGSAGKVVTLLSSGIDSPVATWMLARRGAVCVPVHFSGRPQTPDTSEYLVQDIIRALEPGVQIGRLYVVPFGDCQREISVTCPSNLRVIMYRRIMYSVAERIAHIEGAKAIVTGESLGQVASQTLENIMAVNEAVKIPVFRPLIGSDKQEIIARAEEIGTFDISTEAAPDCCTLFMPRRPETHAKLDAVHEAWELFDHEEMIERLLKQTEYIDFESNTYKAPKTLKRKHSELAPREIYQDHE